MKSAALGVIGLLAILGISMSEPSIAQSEPPPSEGTLQRINVFGPSLEGNLMGAPAEPEVSVYLPPSYSTDPGRRYPVVYLLHEYSGTDLGWFGAESRMQADAGAERAFSSGAAREMILVMPNAYNVYGGSMYSSSVTTGDWEAYIAEDLVAYMDSHYRTIPSRESRGLAGHSMGGYGTLRIGMKRPDVFSSLYNLSACCLMDNPGAQGRGGRGRGGQAAEAGREQAAGAGGFGDVNRAEAAAWSPNPDNPPEYLDLPVVDGEPQPLAVARWIANSPLVMLPQYVTNLKKHTAIAGDVGLQDGLLGSNEQFAAALRNDASDSVPT